MDNLLDNFQLLGNIQLDVFKYLDKYFLSQSQVAEAIGVHPFYVSRFLGSEEVKALLGEDYTDHKIAIERNGNGKRGGSQVKVIPVRLAVKFWSSQAYKGNTIATREKVFAAADKLFAQGEIVTKEKVRKEVKGGSHSTISKYLREWKEQEDNEIPVKTYPMPESIKKTYDEMRDIHWNAFCTRYEQITDNQIIAELEEENNTLRERLEVTEEDSIRLKQLQELYNKAIEQQRQDAAEIRELRNYVDRIG